MSEMDEGIVNEFVVEGHECLAQVESDLLALERDPTDPKKLASIFRAVHTIKGTCGFLGFTKLESVAHAGESFLSRLRAGEIRFQPEIATALLSLVDALREILVSIETTRAEGEGDYAAIIETFARLERGETAAPTAPGDAPPVAPVNAPPAAPAGTAPSAPTPPPAVAPGAPASPPSQISGLLDPLIASGRLDPDAVIAAAQQQRLGDPRRIGEILVDHGALKSQDILEALIARGEAPASAITEGNIRVDVHLLDLLMNLVGELVLARNQMLQYVSSQDFQSLPATTQRLNSITTELQEGIMKTRMQPIANLCNKLPRLARDVSAACGKQVRLQMEGIETELDRTIIEAIRDPLTHLVRNAIDHGIETSEVRAARGKPAVGSIVVSAFHEGGKVIIDVRDDGAGLSVDRIRERALSMGLVAADRIARMTDNDWFHLIFAPGFSTAERVTHVSGRGVGMDVVKTNVERIGGAIDIASTPGEGTQVKLRIPLTLAIIPALIVAAGGDHYAIPQVNLVELVRTDGEAGTSAIAEVYDVQVYRYRDSLVPLVFLHDALRLGGPIEAAVTASGETSLHIVVVQADGVPFGLVVDEIKASQEIVVKPLAEVLKKTAVFSGATILGDGGVAFIIDVPGLARHTGVARVASRDALATAPAPTEAPLGVSQTLVLLRLRGDRRVAIPLAAVARLEEIPGSAVERAGNRRLVQYRGGILSLVPMLDLLEPGDRSAASEPQRLPVVVHERDGRSVGVIVEEILEIVQETLELTPVAGRPELIGSGVIRGRVTDVIDLPALLDRSGPGGFSSSPAQAVGA